jgi:nitrate reductase gamma subunit
VTLPALLLLAAFVVAAASLAHARFGIGSVRTWRYAPPRAPAGSGVRYAFTTAFLPWAKESASGHPASYLAGIVYHAGIFAMLACLALSLTALQAPPLLANALSVLLGVALAAGLCLLVKRLADVALRAISVPDDFVANLLVDAALAAAVAAALVPSARFVFQLTGAALLLYAPLGKLRHMLFLLTSRRLWGVYYGRRGVLP